MDPLKTQHIKEIYHILKVVFIILPIVAGVDKFFNILTDWTQYINPIFLDVLPLTGVAFMMIVGIIEISAGLLVLLNPRIGGYIVSGWLVGIALSLLVGWMYVDVAVRDIVMAISAFSMAKLSKLVE